MKKKNFIALAVIEMLLTIASASHAGVPLWTFTPLTATTQSVPANGTATVQYQVTNQSTKAHTLNMQTIRGITQVTAGLGICGNPFALSAHGSCILSLQLDGSHIASGSTNGPVVCESGSVFQCYRPSPRDILNITVTGSQYSLGGSIFGLTDTVYLQNNGLDPQAFSSDGSFTFVSGLTNGSTYDLTIQSQPANQTCSVFNGTGTINGSDVTNVTVTCSTNAYTVGGTVSGLSGTVVLLNNGGDAITITSNGAFTFATPVAEGSSYNVTVQTQPSGQTCMVNNGSGIIGGSNVTNVVVNCADNTTTLSASLSSLALSVNDTSLNAALTGNPRQLTITNTGSADAVNVVYSASPALPVGTSITPSSCGTISASGGTCILTITPGANPSALPGDTNPTPIALTIQGDNTNALIPELNILTYGSVYQGGYLFSVDDSYTDYPESVSIGGAVAALSDQSSSITWTPTISPLPPMANTNIWGIADTSTTISPVPNSASTPAATQYPGQLNCNGNSDGACDTNNIYVYYQNDSSSAPVPVTDYAAGLCKQVINSYSDWYLPSICQLGYSSNSASSGCGTQSTPTMQNMQSALVDASVSGVGLSSTQGYWSATQVMTGSLNAVWAETFVTVGGSQQAGATKRQTTSASNVRCVRTMTP